MYEAIEIAKYIINKCIEWNRPISNLQLQKILYYVQGEYIKSTGGEELFNDRIEAWTYGPVVPSVYYEFNVFSSSNINLLYDVKEIEDRVREIIDPVIESKSLLSAWKLVENTHKEMPWMSSYEEGRNNTIEIDVMRKFFCN
ncbi:Panacea domain-containing protein [Clostridium perfringens]|uniref:Panacea domain-containing protein n=1 Tax=Clostridium perfringens TaxID=1502 RepID=UPI0013E34B0B|nr:type II toxin-antitoxin system antitoxin SocA domain-containing protein [Clostridium perfringens]MDT7931421.1 DUF4065 domain-containing protein [Clostridium perfringens]MDT7955366.1 DUF4065 domain-containing protein [Clostridium perfringens]